MYFKRCLSILVNIVINTYFNNSRCIYFITQNSFHYNRNLTIINLSNINDNNLQVLKFGCPNFVIENNEPQAIINKLEHHMKLQLQRFNERKYLILPNLNTSENLYNILSISALQFVPDILVIVPEIDYNISTSHSLNSIMQEGKIKFQLFTHQFVGLTNNNEIIVLDEFHCSNTSFEFNNILYPDKIRNMERKVLKIATFSYKPYSILDNNRTDVDGTEMRIAIEYSKKHNCTIEFVVDEINEWGEIYDNWTGNGILGNLVMDYADLGLGALYTWYHEFTFLDLSVPVVRTGVTCLAPAPRLVSGWFSPFFPFNLTLWIAVSVSFIVAVLAYLFIIYLNIQQMNREENERNTNITSEAFLILYMMVRIFLLQSWSSLKELDRESIRYFLSSILIFSLLIATCYNSGLASSMTVPRYEKAIQTVEDLAETNMKWGATHAAWIFSIMSATQPQIVKIRNNFKLLNEEQLRAHTTTKNYAFALERLPAGHYAIGDYITKNDVSQLLLMTEDIYWEYCVLMTRKNSPFLPSLNQLILEIHASGLPTIWESQVALRHLDYQVQLKVKVLSQQRHPDQEPIKLKITHIQGVFVIWLGGLLIATFTFFVELYIHQKKN